MTRTILLVITLLPLVACGGATPAATTPASPEPAATAPSAGADDESVPATAEATSNEFRNADEGAEKEARLKHPSKIEPTATEAAVKLFLVDKDKGPIPGIVVTLTGPDGVKHYAEETGADGYTELLVPAGHTYDVAYLSLGIGRRDIVSKIDVANEPNLNLRLTLRYKRWIPPVQPARTAATKTPEGSPRFSLEGVEFDTGKATITKDSLPKLQSVVEYMTHKKSARIEISGHTDNVGNAKANQALSAKRAESVRTYLVSQGIAKSRIDAVGYGDTLPVADNATEEGRKQNRRIEATELY